MTQQHLNESCDERLGRSCSCSRVHTTCRWAVGNQCAPTCGGQQTFCSGKLRRIPVSSSEVLKPTSLKARAQQGVTKWCLINKCGDAATTERKGMATTVFNVYFRMWLLLNATSRRRSNTKQQEGFSELVRTERLSVRVRGDQEGKTTPAAAISSVVECLPLNWKVGCSIHDHWVNRRSAPWATAFTSTTPTKSIKLRPASNCRWMYLSHCMWSNKLLQVSASLRLTNENNLMIEF